MGLCNSAPVFCMSTETVADMENTTVIDCSAALPHLLEAYARHQASEDTGALVTTTENQWYMISCIQQLSATEAMDVYMDDFISLIQGGAMERIQMLRHLFHTINRIFYPNEPADANRKEPISLKKFQKGYTSCSTS